MKKEGEQIIISINESKEIIQSVLRLWGDVPDEKRSKYCCGFLGAFNRFKKTVEDE